MGLDKMGMNQISVCNQSLTKVTTCNDPFILKVESVDQINGLNSSIAHTQSG